MNESCKFSSGGVSTTWDFFMTIHSLISPENKTVEEALSIFLYSAYKQENSEQMKSHILTYFVN